MCQSHPQASPPVPLPNTLLALWNDTCKHINDIRSEFARELAEAWSRHTSAQKSVCITSVHFVWLCQFHTHSHLISSSQLSRHLFHIGSAWIRPPTAKVISWCLMLCTVGYDGKQNKTTAPGGCNIQTAAEVDKKTEIINVFLFTLYSNYCNQIKVLS